jgi:hypothetical protein
VDEWMDGLHDVLTRYKAFNWDRFSCVPILDYSKYLVNFHYL